jgi:hypothetical protein
MRISTTLNTFSPRAGGGNIFAFGDLPSPRQGYGGHRRGNFKPIIFVASVAGQASFTLLLTYP